MATPTMPHVGHAAMPASNTPAAMPAATTPAAMPAATTPAERPTASTPVKSTASTSAATPSGKCRDVRHDAKRAHRNACRQNA
jgi:hypothetical protein